MTFKIGDVVTVEAQLTAHPGLRGTVVEIATDPEDRMPYTVDFGEEWGRHNFGSNELKLTNPVLSPEVTPIEATRSSPLTPRGLPSTYLPEHQRK